MVWEIPISYTPHIVKYPTRHAVIPMLPDQHYGTTIGERQGQYWDREVASDLSMCGQNQAKTFVFLDACFSGIPDVVDDCLPHLDHGIIEELVKCIPNVIGTTTCSKKGYGYDENRPPQKINVTV